MKKNKTSHTLSGLIGGIAMLIAGAGCVAAVAPAIETYQAYNIGQGGMKAAQSLQPIGLEEEKSIGGSLAIQVFNRFGPRRNDPALQRYVSLVGHAIAEVSDRPDIDYYFAVVDSSTRMPSPLQAAYSGRLFKHRILGNWLKMKLNWRECSVMKSRISAKNTH